MIEEIKKQIDHVEVKSDRTAKLIVKLIPASCPFERDIKFFNKVVAHIPSLCKLNPFYDQLVGLRFRALCKIETQ